MDGLRILHAGDFHIGATRSTLGNTRGMGRAEIKNTFFKVLDICRTNSVDFLLIAGDLFDTPFPDADTVAEIIHAISQTPDTIIAISPGNHDCACPGSVYLSYTFPENVFIFTSFVEYFDFPEKNTRLYGAAFTDRFEKLPLLSGTTEINPDMINLCVLHGDIVSSHSDSLYNPITPDTIKTSGFDYLALGHIHKRSDIQKCGNTFYAYCGCPDGKGFDEDGSRGAYLGTIGKDLCNMEYIELSSRKYLLEKTDITECQNSLEVSSKILGEIKQKYPHDFGNNLYRIYLTGTLSTDVSLNTTQIESILNQELSYAKVYDNTDTVFSSIKAIAGESSLRGIFVQKMLEMTENADSNDLDTYKKALKLGLKAFEKEVLWGDN